MIRSLHLQSMRNEDLHGGHDEHALFQASTVSALLDGAYDGDLTFADLASQGDTGLGTLNGLDGEMIAVDGQFLRCDVNGDVTEVMPNAYTPFAVVCWFEAESSLEIKGPAGLGALTGVLDTEMKSELPVAAFRIDGHFRSVTARSVPGQKAPYRGLVEVLEDQNVFEIPETDGTVIGFRFPIYSEGIEVAGYHLHFVDADRLRGGHVLDLEIESGTVKACFSDDLHVELPPGLDLASPDLADSTHEAIQRAENSKGSDS